MASIPHPIDIHVGLKLRQRRTLLGLSQSKLGDAVALTFQQIQKYERGSNRISASKLFYFSQILDVPLDYFFEDMPPESLDKLNDPQFRADGGPGTDHLSRRETLELVRSYYAIADPALRKRILRLARAVADSQDGKEDS